MMWAVTALPLPLPLSWPKVGVRASPRNESQFLFFRLRSIHYLNNCKYITISSNVWLPDIMTRRYRAPLGLAGNVYRPEWKLCARLLVKLSDRVVYMYRLHVAREKAVCHNHTIHQTEILALLDRWVRNTASFKMLCAQKNCLSL